jgi:hypothetical protein
MATHHLPSSGAARLRALENGQRRAHLYHSPQCLQARGKARFDAVLEGIVGNRWKAQEVLFVDHATHLSPELAHGAKKNLVYVRNQKVASTYFYSNVQSYSGASKQGVHSTRWNFRRAGSRAKRQQQQRVVFTFVREPVKAFISGWMQSMCFVKHRMKGAEFDRGGAGLKAAQGQSPLMGRNSSKAFQLFLDDYQNGRFLGNAATHVWPQADKIDCVDSDAFSFIGKVENFADDMSALFPNGRLPPANHKADDDACKKAMMKTFTYGRAETLALCKILAVDFECFGYAIPVECAGAVAATARSRSGGTAKGIKNGHPNATLQPTTKNLL